MAIEIDRRRQPLRATAADRQLLKRSARTEVAKDRVRHPHQLPREKEGQLAQARHGQPEHRKISSPTASTPRANPYPEVTDPICRFPLPTFFYRLEAVHLGDLMRISVRASASIQKRNPPTRFSRASRERPRTPQKRDALRDRLFTSVYPKPSRSTTEFQGLGPSSRKENSSRGSRQLLWLVSRYRDHIIELIVCTDVAAAWFRN